MVDQLLCHLLNQLENQSLVHLDLLLTDPLPYRPVIRVDIRAINRVKNRLADLHCSQCQDRLVNRVLIHLINPLLSHQNFQVIDQLHSLLEDPLLIQRESRVLSHLDPRLIIPLLSQLDLPRPFPALLLQKNPLQVPRINRVVALVLSLP